MNIDCVILAAGASARMGKNKMTLKIGEKTVIERCMDAFYDSCSRIIVVTGKYREDINQCLAPYSKVNIVCHADYQQGMFSSVKEGVKRVTSERFFITPGDYPLLDASTIHRMVNMTGCFVVPVYRNRQGHPILLDKRFVPEILNSTCTSLRDCLQRTSVKKREVRVGDIGVVTDIDTMEEYNQAAAIFTLNTKD